MNISEEAKQYLVDTGEEEFTGIRPSFKARRIIESLIDEIERLQKDVDEEITEIAGHIKLLGDRTQELKKAEAEIKRLQAELAKELGI